jgi:Sulfotransferase family
MLFFFIFYTFFACAEAPLFFYHLPKCGGTTVHSMIAQKFHEKEIYHILDHQQFIMNFDQFENVKFFAGHIEFYYGNIVVPEARRFTFLRDPIDRLVSQYNYTYRNDKTPPLFHDYARMNANFQVKMLSSYPPQNCHITIEEHLESAKANLREAFFFVGIVERMAESMAALYKILGWEAPEETPNFNPSLPIDSTCRPEELHRENWADYELYAYAQKIFTEQLSLADQIVIYPPKIEFTGHIHYTFDQPLDGSGWSYRERVKSYGNKCVRTTYRQEAHIFFPLLSGRDYQLEFTAASPPNDVLNDLEILVNGQPLPYKRCTFCEWSRFEGCIPGGVLTSQKTKITFKIPRLFRHKDPLKRRDDPRSYGLRVSEISIFPK